MTRRELYLTAYAERYGRRPRRTPELVDDEEAPE